MSRVLELGQGVQFDRGFPQVVEQLDLDFPVRVKGQGHQRHRGGQTHGGAAESGEVAGSGAAALSV